MKKYLPVYNFIGNENKPVPLSEVLEPKNIYFDAVTGNMLKAPPFAGDLRPDGQQYHVGEKFGNIISYHNPYQRPYHNPYQHTRK